MEEEEQRIELEGCAVWRTGDRRRRCQHLFQVEVMNRGIVDFHFLRDPGSVSIFDRRVKEETSSLPFPSLPFPSLPFLGLREEEW